MIKIEKRVLNFDFTFYNLDFQIQEIVLKHEFGILNMTVQVH